MDPELREYFMTLNNLVMAIKEKQNEMDARMLRIEQKLDKLQLDSGMDAKMLRIEKKLVKVRPDSGNRSKLYEFHPCETLNELELLENKLKQFAFYHVFKDWLESKIYHDEPKKRAFAALRLIISPRLQMDITWTGRAKDRDVIAMKNYKTVLQVIKQVSGQFATNEEVKKWVQIKLHHNCNIPRLKGALTAPPPHIESVKIEIDPLGDFEQSV